MVVAQETAQIKRAKSGRLVQIYTCFKMAACEDIFLLAWENIAYLPLTLSMHCLGVDHLLNRPVQ